MISGLQILGKGSGIVENNGWVSGTVNGMKDRRRWKLSRRLWGFYLQTFSKKYNFQNRSMCFCCWNIAFISRSRKERIFIWRKFNPFYQKCLSWPWLFSWNKDPLNFQSKDVFICLIISSLALENMMLKRQKLHHIYSVKLSLNAVNFITSSGIVFWFMKSCLHTLVQLWDHIQKEQSIAYIYSFLKPFIQFNF